MKKLHLISMAALSISAAFYFANPSSTDISKFEMVGETVLLKDEPTSWRLDKKHSNVTFNAMYMGIAPVAGKFTEFEGTMVSSKADFSDAEINFKVNAASVNTDDEGRDNHLRRDDFFNAELYPEASFKSTSFKPLGDNKYELKGDLTIRDVTKPITIDVKYGGSIKDQRGNTRIGFAGKTIIDRFAYGVKWDSKTPEGNYVVDKDVELVVNIQLRAAAAK